MELRGKRFTHLTGHIPAFPHLRHDVRAHKLSWDKTEGLKSRALIANVRKGLLRQMSRPQCPLLAPGLLQNIYVLC